jgi:uncharacterized protein
MERQRIPLFPLNTVLFPGMPLPLHIFESRYQQMVRWCLDGERPFGVCLIQEGQEVGGPAQPYAVGTLCEIVTHTPLEDGRLLLHTVGRERFRVRQLFHDKPYLEAEVELFADAASEGLEPLAQQAREAAGRFLAAVLGPAELAEAGIELPDDPISLSYVLGAVVPASLPVRQQLLSTSATDQRLRLQIRLLEEQIGNRGRREGSSDHVATHYRVDPEKIHLN